MLENIKIDKLEYKKKIGKISKKKIKKIPEVFYFQKSKLDDLLNFVDNPSLYQNLAFVGTSLNSSLSEISDFLNESYQNKFRFYYEDYFNFLSFFGENSILENSQDSILLLPLKIFFRNELCYPIFKSFISKKKIDFSYLPETEFFSKVDRSYKRNINIRFIFLGSSFDFEQMYSIDDSFSNLFQKEIVLSDYACLNDIENIESFCNRVQDWRQKKYPNISDCAIEALLYLHCKFYENSYFFPTDVTYIKKVFLEAIQENSKTEEITQLEILKAYESLTSKFSHEKAFYHEELKNKVFKLDFQKEKVGRVNAISIIENRSPFEQYGMITEVSARVFSGSGSIINIEKEVNLSGGIYDKGVFILQSYLKGIFSFTDNFSLDISITFEQSHAHIDGDSATIAELIAIFSAITQIPVPSNISITGSLSQYGEALPVGGINQKIDACAEISSILFPDGEFKIYIPKINVNEFFLDRQTLKRIKMGKFKVISYENVSDLVKSIFETPHNVNLMEILENKLLFKETEENIE